LIRLRIENRQLRASTSVQARTARVCAHVALFNRGNDDAARVPSATAYGSRGSE
jgi:hypothetical protein